MFTSKLTDSGFAAVTALTQISFLEMGYNLELTDAALTHIGQLTQLETLQLNGQANFTDAGLQKLSGLHRLRLFQMPDGPKVTDVGLSLMLSQHPELEVIGIVGRSLTLAPIAHAQKLQTVFLNGEQLTLDGLKVLQASAGLRTLDLANGRSEDLQRVAQIPQLRNALIHFYFADGPYPGDKAFASLARLPHLEYIEIEGHQSPSDAVLETWAACATLQRLNLHSDKGKARYTPAGIAKFRELRPDVELHVDGQDYPAMK